MNEIRRFFDDYNAAFQTTPAAIAEFYGNACITARMGVATVHWAYQDDAGKTLAESTFSYNLYRIEGAWKILLQTRHDT